MQFDFQQSLKETELPYQLNFYYTVEFVNGYGMFKESSLKSSLMLSNWFVLC